jgi:hypothetical protein
MQSNSNYKRSMDRLHKKRDAKLAAIQTIKDRADDKKFKRWRGKEFQCGPFRGIPSVHKNRDFGRDSKTASLTFIYNFM